MRIPVSLLILLSCLLGLSSAARGAEGPPPGLYLSTDYPALTIQAGETSNIPIHLGNVATPPERLQLRVDGVPPDWDATLMGDGRPVNAAMPREGGSLTLQLRLKVPAGSSSNSQQLTLHADGAQHRLSLPLEVRLADQLPPRLSVKASLPQLTGSARTSFDYELTLKNESGQNALVNLAAQAPSFFDTSFTEGYGTQQVSAVPVEAGASKTVKLHVKPPRDATSGEHEITVQASAEGAQAATRLALTLTGQPELALSGRDGLMSTRAQIGSTTSTPLVLSNNGSATAQDIALDATAPSGWQVSFEPDRLDALAPGKTAELQAHITPAPKALAGDYMVKLNARSQGQSASGDFRVAVATSGLWGVIGVILIAIALLILIGAVARYGRR